MQNFINRHTALGILLLILVCFFAGYYLGERTERSKHTTSISPDCEGGLCI